MLRVLKGFLPIMENKYRFEVYSINAWENIYSGGIYFFTKNVKTEFGHSHFFMSYLSVNHGEDITGQIREAKSNGADFVLYLTKANAKDRKVIITEILNSNDYTNQLPLNEIYS